MIFSTGTAIDDQSEVIDVAEARSIAEYFATRTEREVAEQFASFAASGADTRQLNSAAADTIWRIQNGHLPSVFVEANARQSMKWLRSLEQYCAYHQHR